MPSDDSTVVIHSLPRAALPPPMVPPHAFRSLRSPWRAPPRPAAVPSGVRTPRAVRGPRRAAG